jgi:hypothetical protein
LDNIGVFDRSAPLPTGGFLEQADGTAWMAMYCQNMLGIILELAAHNPSMESIATKFVGKRLGNRPSAGEHRSKILEGWQKTDGSIGAN